MSGRESWTGIAVAQLWRSDMKQNASNKNQTPMLYVVVTKNVVCSMASDSGSVAKNSSAYYNMHICKYHLIFHEIHIMHTKQTLYS